MNADPRLKFGHLATLAIDFHSKSDKETVMTIFTFLLRKMLLQNMFDPAFIALERIVVNCPAFLYEYQQNFIPVFVDCFEEFGEETADTVMVKPYEFFRSRLKLLERGILNNPRFFNTLGFSKRIFQYKVFNTNF